MSAVSPNRHLTWGDFEELRMKIASIADDVGFRKDLYFNIMSDSVRLTVRIDGYEMTGKGCDPWEAVKDLINRSGSLADVVKRHLGG